MNKILRFALVGMMTAFGMTSCSEDNAPQEPEKRTVSITVNKPENMEQATISNVRLTVKNISTGTTQDYTLSTNTADANHFSGNTIKLVLQDGLYDIAFKSALEYTLDGKTAQAEARGLLSSVTVTSTTATTPLVMKTFYYNSATVGKSFVIAEIYSTGTMFGGKVYLGDTYFRIYNNSGDTLYADGLTIAESQFTSSLQQTIVPNIVDTAFTVQALYRVPGNGTQHKVLPGESLLLCDIGKDHRSANNQSFDLSKADFEWYDVSSVPKQQDTDTEVANLEKVYAATKTIWFPTQQENRSYVLTYLGNDPKKPLTAEEYVKKYEYEFKAGKDINIAKARKGYYIPNRWILDAVNLSIKSEHVWNPTAPALDAGYTAVATIAKDPARYGKSLRRKVLSGKVLQDTNNSTNDFEVGTANPYHAFWK